MTTIVSDPVPNTEMDRRIAELADKHRLAHIDPTVRVTHVDPATLRGANGSNEPPRNTHPKARERDEEILGLLRDGPKTTTQISAALGTGDDSRQILSRLAQRGKIKPEGRTSEQGGAVLWSLVEGPAKVHVAMPPPSEDAVLAVLGRMFRSTREVGEAVGCTTQAVRRVLEGLEAKDAVVKQEGPPLQWRLPDASAQASGQDENDDKNTPIIREPQADATESDHASGQSDGSDSGRTIVEAKPEPPTVIEEISGEPRTYDQIFEEASDGMAEVITEEWMEQHAQRVVDRWVRQNIPAQYWPDDAAASAYLTALLDGLRRSTVGTGPYFSICDRIERVIWGTNLKDGASE